MEQKASNCDNVLLEWALALEFEQRGMLRGIYPLFVGNETEGQPGHRGEYFPDINALPQIVQDASSKKALDFFADAQQQLPRCVPTKRLPPKQNKKRSFSESKTMKRVFYKNKPTTLQVVGGNNRRHLFDAQLRQVQLDDVAECSADLRARLLISP